jgi:CRISPR-associated endonuclease/helicase Cas3
MSVSSVSTPASLLLSHPHKALSEHIHEVRKAALWLLSTHSEQSVLVSEEFGHWVKRVCQLHDLGKGSQAFQSYIRDPEGYGGRPSEKAHTPLSTYLTSHLLEVEGVEPLLKLAVLQVVLNHHGALRDREGLMSAFEQDGRMALLERQLQGLELQALSTASGEELTVLEGLEEVEEHCFQIVDWLWELWDWMEQHFEQEPEALVAARLWSQLLFSVLLEADKALLAISEEEKYLSRQEVTFSLRQLKAFLAGAEDNELNRLRTAVRSEMLERLEEVKEEQRLFSLCLPTGLGKTLTAAAWAFQMRERWMPEARVVVVMPFLSVIDQTEAVYRSMLGVEEQGEVVMASHSLAERRFDSEEGGEAEFFLDTWRSSLILTTYDQLLLALMSPKGRHQMRLHNLCDALLIFDELQSVPCRLWKPLEALLSSLCNQGNSRLLAMSATLPALFSETTPLLSRDTEERCFARFGRYELRLELEPCELETFVEQKAEECVRGDWSGERVLLVMNTRRSARTLRDALEAITGEAPFFLTADVTPAERLEQIERLREGAPCVVVATQCIEAGVDLDFSRVFRDMAPLDSLVQVAGRCNRHARRPRCTVHVLSLLDGGRSLARRIYDPVHLDATWSLLQGREKVMEEEVLGLSRQYFAALEKRKDTGEDLLRDFVLWKEHPKISGLLRGEQSEQCSVVILREEVVEEAELLEEMEALEKERRLKHLGRWELRRRLRSLGAKLSKYTVTFYPKPGFVSGQVANLRLGCFWCLEPVYYQTGRGLLLPEQASCEVW